MNSHYSEDLKKRTHPETNNKVQTTPSRLRVGRFPVALFLVAILLAGVYYFSPVFSPNSADRTKLDPVVVRLGWVHQAQFAGFYVAQEKGFYADEGLSVALADLNLTVDQVEEVAQGHADFSVMEAHQFLVAVSEGADIQAITAVYQVNPHVLAARADSGITGPEDFDGKVFGLAGGSGEGNALFRVFVDRYSDAKSVTYKNLNFNTVQNLIDREADVVDLYRIDQPYLAEKRGVPLNLISLEAYGLSTYGDVLVTNNTLIRSRPDVVERFVSATLKGWEYALTHPDEAVAHTLPYSFGDYHDHEYESHIFQQSIPLVRGTAQDLGYMDLVRWSTLYESMRQAHVLRNEFDVSTAYTNKFIK